MNKIGIFSVVVCILFVLSILPARGFIVTDSSENHNTGTFPAICSLEWPPSWNIGDTWVYDVELTTYMEDYFPITLSSSIDDLSLSIVSQSADLSTFELEGTIDGCIEALIKLAPIPFDIVATGWLKRTTVDGYVIMTSTDFGITEINLHLHGKARVFISPLPILIPLPFDLTLTITCHSPYLLLGFTQMDVGAIWVIPETTFSIHAVYSPFLGIFSKTFTLDDLSPPEWADIYTECMGIEMVTVPAGTYDAYKVWVEEGGIIEYFYAPQVNNIIKLQTNEELEYFTLRSELQSTTV